MMLSVALALLAAAATFGLLLPLLRQPRQQPSRLQHELAIYRDQLAELERDLAAGRIAAADIAAARTEIERRILAAADSAATIRTAVRELRVLPVALTVLLPGAAMLIYLATGRPELPAQPFASRPAAVDPAQAQAERAIADLRHQIAEKPEELERYRILAQLLMAVDRASEAVATMREAMKRGAAGADALAQLGEALTLEAEGTVVPEAQALFGQALALQPGDPRARFYLGRVEQQAGNARAALELWLALEADAPPDAPWLATVTAEIDRLAASSGIDPSAINPQRRAAMRGPSRDDIARMQQLSPQERETAIRGMVEGLEARLKETPDDLQGWLRLANAWKQLGELDRAAAALQQADRLKPDDPKILGDLAEALVLGSDRGKPPGPVAIAVLQRLEKLQPDNALALFFLGEAAFAAGDPAEALRRFERLLTMIPADAPLRPAIEKRLREIEAGK